MLKQIFSAKSNTIASAAVIVASFSILSRLVGLVRDRILAGTFGAGDELDIYFAAFRVPDFLFQLIIVGALSASFIPLFTKYYSKRKHEKAWLFTSNILNIITLAFGLVVLLAILLSPQIASLVAPGFAPEKQLAVAEMARVMFIAQFFLAISMVFGSVLQGAKHFVLYSLAPIVYNIGIVGGVVFLVPTLGPMGAAWGVVIGAILHLLLQWLGVMSLGYRYRFILKFKDRDVRYTLTHMLPRVMGLAVNQINFIAMTAIASTLAVGSVTILQFAYSINFFPIGVIAISYAIAAFPTFCELAQKKNQQQFVDSFSSTVRQILFFIIPATFVFLLLRAQIVRVVLGAGLFDWDATILTADTLGFFVVSLFAQAIVFVLVRAYFAHSETIIPFFVGLAAAVCNVVVALLVTPSLGVVGFGLSYALAALLQMALLWLLLRGRIGTLDEKRISRSFGRLVIAGLAGALATQAMKSLVVEVITLDTFFGVFAQGLIAGLVGLAVYGAMAYLLKSEEMTEFLRGMKRRLFRKVEPEETVLTNMGQ